MQAAVIACNILCQMSRLNSVHASAACWTRLIPVGPPVFAKVVGDMPKEALSFKDWPIDFALGGVSGAVSKTLTAPIERVKLVIQTQDANPKIRSGEVARYTGIGIS